MIRQRGNFCEVLLENTASFAVIKHPEGTSNDSDECDSIKEF